jgi:hypothetical protein
VNRRPGHVDVTTEVGFCNFCNRTRNLRREAHHLGALVRMIVSCETCHRTLSSSVGVASTEPEAAPAPQPEPARVEVAAEGKPKPKRAPAKRAPAKRATKPKATGKAKVPAKPRSTATRRTSRKK